MVLKMRSGAHSKDIREYEITSSGIAIGGRLKDFSHLITGIPTRVRASASAIPTVKPGKS
jgi:circadian clock protein KaiC